MGVYEEIMEGRWSGPLPFLTRKKRPPTEFEPEVVHSPEDPEKYRHAYWAVIRSKYDLSPAEFGWLLYEQGFACALCKRPWEVNFHVDHDHETWEIRGILCPSCNSSLGGIEKFLRKGLLDKVFAYLDTTTRQQK